MARNALGLEFGSTSQLSQGWVVSETVYEICLKDLLGSITGMYPSPEFLSSATWPLLLKKHYNGFVNYPRNINRKFEANLCSSFKAVKYVILHCDI